jgi:multicomponent Na+:H+ antiporter subunit G
MLAGAGWVICTLGTVVILIAAIGVVRLPDALSRQHAATKAGTAAVILFASGVAMIMQDSAWSWRLLAIVVLLLFTLPLASHALSRAATREMSDNDV